MTTYQRLKAENERLKKELFIVCNDQKCEQSQMIIAKYRLLLKAESSFWAGNSLLKQNNFKGLLHQLRQ